MHRAMFKTSLFLALLTASVVAYAEEAPPSSREGRQVLHAQPAKQRSTSMIATVTPEGVNVFAAAIDPKGIRTITIRGNAVDFITCKGVPNMQVASCAFVWKVESLRTGVNNNSLYANIVGNTGERWNVSFPLTKP